MKATITLSDELLEQTKNAAVSMGLSMNRMFEIALKEFLENHFARNNQPDAEISADTVNGELDRFLDVGLEALRKATENDPW